MIQTADMNIGTKGSKIRLLLSGMFSSKGFAVGFPFAVTALSLMYYNTASKSVIRFPIMQAPHEILISILLGLVVSLGVLGNIYVMKAVMDGGEEVMKAASKTSLSMAAGACGCIGSFASLLVSLGVGAGTGFLAMLSANLLIFFVAAGLLSLVSLKLAADTLSNVSHLLKIRPMA
ncbi:MAG: hypothetical protein M1344_03325 [Candidatus Thermoplasmatota archaeon]|nr:hypothetical protein [Candidatus Thermoplasmatota archaeon]